ncbi:MAG TPA: AI-2E family transporter [Longimicrobiales bacterium]|nr:AI-2E family transporter [Longimicrobiales bacterium]
MSGPPAVGERRSRALGWRSRDVLRATALVTGYLLALAVLWVAREILLTAFLGVLFGLAVGAGATHLARLRIPRGIGAALVVFGFLGALYGVGASIAPTLREQGVLLRTQVPAAVDRIEAWMNARPGFAALLLGGREVTPSRATVPNTTAQSRTAGPPRTGVSSPGAPPDSAAAPAGPTLGQRVTAQLSGAARYLFPFLSSTLTVVAGLFLVVVLSIYVGADPAVYHRGLMHLFPHPARDQAGAVLTRIATVLRKWLVTQLVAMLVIGVVSTVTLAVLHVKAAVALGVIAGLLEFVPTIGPIMAAIPAVAMGFLDSPEKALSVAVAYLVIQQLEGHVLIPMLMKEGMDLPPALTIVTQGVMALLFGFLGLMVAVPLLATVIVPIKLLYVQGVLGDAVYDEEENDEPITV